VLNIQLLNYNLLSPNRQGTDRHWKAILPVCTKIMDLIKRYYQPYVLFFSQARGIDQKAFFT